VTFEGNRVGCEFADAAGEPPATTVSFVPSFSVLDSDKELFPSAASPCAKATQPTTKKVDSR
jgi:hypothetical protein